jgi:hypothetical protein
MAWTSIPGALRLKIRDALRPATRNGRWAVLFPVHGIALSWAAPTLSCISNFRYRFLILRCLCG